MSIVGVLVALVIVGIGVVALMRVSEMDQELQASARSKRSVRDVESSLRVYLWSQLRSYAATGCNPSKFYEIFTDQKIGATGIPRVATKSIPSLGSAPTIHRDAAARCHRLVIGSAFQSNFHFCLHVESEAASETRGSFLASNKPFVEVAINLFDASDGTPMTCSALALNPSVTARIHYALFWSRDGSNGKQIFDRYVAWYDASQ